MEKALKLERSKAEGKEGERMRWLDGIIDSMDQTQRTNIKSSKGKTANHTQVDSHKDNS